VWRRLSNEAMGACRVAARNRGSSYQCHGGASATLQRQLNSLSWVVVPTDSFTIQPLHANTVWTYEASWTERRRMVQTVGRRYYSSCPDRIPIPNSSAIKSTLSRCCSITRWIQQFNLIATPHDFIAHLLLYFYACLSTAFLFLQDPYGLLYSLTDACLLNLLYYPEQ